MMFDEEMDSVTDLVKMALTTEERFVLRKLQIVMNICQMLEAMELNPDFKKDADKMKEFAQNLLLKTDFRRAVFKRTALMEREPIVYFGDVVAKEDYYDYDEALENDLTQIDFAIARFLGNVLKQVQAMQGI